jgi:2-iminobutanoate/2-iminopropanoate deaminase
MCGIARREANFMDGKCISAESAPKAIGPYSQGMAAGGWVFCSGQLGLSPVTGELVPGGVTAQTERALRNLSAVLEAAGSSLSKVVKTTVFLTDLSHFKEVNEAYAVHFPAHPPARSTVQVAALPKGASIEIEAIARA